MLNKLSTVLASIAIGTAAVANPAPDTIALPIPNVIEDPTYKDFPGTPFKGDFYVGVVRVLDDTIVKGYKDVLMYSGPIKENSTEVIRFFADQYPEIEEISLNSPGGVAYESFEMGQYFSERGLSTTVSPGKICLSSCAIAFIGGTNYKIDGILGFHTAWLSLDLKDLPEGISVDMLNMAYKSGQQIGAQLSYYMRVNGFHDFLTLNINGKSDKDNFLSFTHEDELNEWYVRAPRGEVDSISNYYGDLPEGIVDRIKVMGGQDFIAHLSDPANMPSGSRLRLVHTAKLFYPLTNPLRKQDQ